ncbi:MAG TPA: hypothetical protein VJU61_11965 [Polyangiaceae bacterium]|nr:hypothetical protein [Polyangiaceae bacterium]
MSFENDGELVQFEMFNIRAMVSLATYNRLMLVIGQHPDFARFEAVKALMANGSFYMHREDAGTELRALTKETSQLWQRLMLLTFNTVEKVLRE